VRLRADGDGLQWTRAGERQARGVRRRTRCERGRRWAVWLVSKLPIEHLL
jgi:hypothetical protein